MTAEPALRTRTRTALDTLRTVELAELQAVADLQTRVDRKYIIGSAVAADLITALGDGLRVLELDGARDFAYESVYFDTPDLSSYFGSAHGRRRKFKVRTRSYLDSGLCVLEVKTTGGRGQTVKERVDYDLASRDVLTSTAQGYLDAKDLPAGDLRATLTTRYRRATLLEDGGARATLDTGLVCISPDGQLARMSGQVLVETKSTGAATAVDRHLWAVGQRPVRVSKYCTGLAALHADLPANRWNRTLRRHFHWQPDRS
ncbi:polyphosphate polymerase domain-containing protein [Nakamurella silvestris]|nr:polyphosphate polymerase domain-containing protein [Nakamurella silvestris]